MADNTASAQNMFYGHKLVTNINADSTTNASQSSNSTNSGSMTANTNATPTPTEQTAQPSLNGAKTTSTLASLANATEPKANTSVNQQTSPVATFPQKAPSANSPTSNNASIFSQPFQFGNPTSATTPPRFSFSSLAKNPPAESTTTTAAAAALPKSVSPVIKNASELPIQTFEQAKATSQGQDDAETPDDIAKQSLVLKKINNTLRDPKGFVVDRNDPNSPLHAMTSFEELYLAPDLLKGIYNMGFQAPSKIQSMALPHLLENSPKNIIAQSQSGTGKTAAFALAILSRIDPANQSPQALVLAPTFELAIQIGSVLEKMSKFLPDIKTAYAVRDPSFSKRNDRPSKKLLPEQIVIGTPGTVEEWCFKLRMIDLSKLRICCVDEADIMIATQGFQENCQKLVKGLQLPRCQMMLFSATYSDEVMQFARTIVPNPVVLRLKRERQTLTNIKQYYVQCYNDEHKYSVVEQIYASLTIGQAMIFCRTKATARNLAIRMANQQHSVRELTAALDIEQRANIIQRFREGAFRVLISTNVTSRGLDIDDVSLVINYDMPVTTGFEPDFETYIHRIGRCGRFGKQGYTFNLIGSERDLDIMQKIEKYFSHPIDEITLDGITQLEQADD